MKGSKKLFKGIKKLEELSPKNEHNSIIIFYMKYLILKKHFEKIK